MSNNDVPPAWFSWQSVVEAGFIAAPVGFLYWCVGPDRGAPHSGIADGAGERRTTYPMIAIVIGALLVAVSGGKPPLHSPAVTMIVVVLALAASGMAVNSWAYHVGLRFRTADPSVGTFLIGHTPTCAFVRWNKDSSPPEGFHPEERYKLILLAESDDAFRLYERPFDTRLSPPANDVDTCANPPPPGEERLADLVYKVSADDVEVDRIPQDRISGR